MHKCRVQCSVASTSVRFWRPEEASIGHTIPSEIFQPTGWSWPHSLHSPYRRPRLCSDFGLSAAGRTWNLAPRRSGLILRHDGRTAPFSRMNILASAVFCSSHGNKWDTCLEFCASAYQARRTAAFRPSHFYEGHRHGAEPRISRKYRAVTPISQVPSLQPPAR